MSEERAPDNEIVQDKAQLHIRVLGMNGSPPDNASVTILDGSDLQGVSLPCDSDGIAHFSDLSPGNYQVWASGPASISALRTLSAFPEHSTQAATDLQLHAATEVTGRVRSNALGVRSTVHLVPIGHDHALFQAQSNPDGSFLFPTIPKGEWETRIVAARYSQSVSKRFSATADKVYVDLPMQQNANIRGQVVNSDSQPIERAQIRIIALGKTTQKSSTGLLMTGTGIRWTHPLPGKRLLPKRDSQRFGAKRSGLRPAECGAGHCGVDLGGQRGSPVLAAADGTVVVASDDDRGKTGRYVALIHKSGFKTFYMHLDSVTADLRIGQTIPAGTLLGTLGRSGIQHSNPHLHFALSRHDRGQNYFLDPEAMLRFAVVRPSAPLLSEKIYELEPAENKDVTAELGSWESDEDGIFSRANIPPGRYRIQATHPDFADATSADFLLRPGQSLKSIRIKLKPGWRLQGQVVSADGPVLDAWVRAFQGEGESRRRVATAQVDEIGRFTMRPLLGRIDLEIGAAGYGVLRTSVPHKPRSDSNQLFTLSTFDTILRGQLRAPNGTPLVSAQVQILSGPAGRGRRDQTDAYGFFQFENLPRGEFRVRFRSEKFPELETPISSDMAAEFTMLEGGSLHLRLRDKHNQQSLPGLRVLAKGPENRTTTLLSDTAGSVHFKALLPGQWTITVDSPDFTPLHSKLSVSAGSISEHKLMLQRGASLKGILYDASGERVPNAKVWLGEITSKTDRNGVFHLARVIPGKNILKAKLGNRSAELPLELFAGDERVTLEITLLETDKIPTSDDGKPMPQSAEDEANSYQALE